MPWLDLTDKAGHTLQLSVVPTGNGPRGVCIRVSEWHGSADPVHIEMDSIGEAERLLSLISSLAGRAWTTDYVGKSE